MDHRVVTRIRANLHISESEFARSVFESCGELSLKAIELECNGIPRAAIAFALCVLAEKWAASGSHSKPIREFVLGIARRFPTHSPKLDDLATEYRTAIRDRDAPRWLPPHVGNDERKDK
jgi:hypothetical protein